MLRNTKNDEKTELPEIRPDITFAVSIVSQFFLAPRTTHLEAVTRILKYLKKASETKLLYSDYEYTRVAGFSYADCVGCPFDRRSTIEYCVFFLRKTLFQEKARSRV